MLKYKGEREDVYTRQKNVYVDGNTVKRRKEDVVYLPAGPRKLSNTARKNREKAYHMSLGYVFFLTCALLAAGVILTGYIGLQSDITNSIQQISSMEQTLNNKKLKNAEDYSRITSSIDLEEVKRVAIQELGMKYAKEGQIMTFSGEGNDYVRQITDIPE